MIFSQIPRSVAAASAVALLVAFPGDSNAQFPPDAFYDSVIKSPINSNITIAFKAPKPGTCTTVFESQKQFTGYINIPPLTLPVKQVYPINTFFWFIEARQSPETAPLTIWLNGGPGSSSMIGLFQESGPCEVVQMADGSYGTRARTWGWDRSSNVMFVDQPTQVGFSYDRLTKYSYFLWNEDTRPVQQPVNPPWALLNGTFASGDITQTANTTAIAAHAIWHFLQGWLAAFPQYNPGTRPGSNATNPTGVNLFAESYGGQYGPTFADFFQEQNLKRLSGDIPQDSTLEIKLASLGIVNGLIDELIQTPYYPKFAHNNTYGIEAISAVEMMNALSDFDSPGGCKEDIQACRSRANNLDSEGEGDVPSVNSACVAADVSCNRILGVYETAGRSYYDIRDLSPESFPSDAYLEYLNTAAVQESIGAPVNFTTSSSAVFTAFKRTGDDIRGTQMESIADLLRRGVRVALIYGDADYICNWMGGEAVSLAIAALEPAYATAFPAAGYADIVVNSSYVGGAVRQFGNFSFSRIYDSGHLVPSYQPETAFTLFTRIIEGTELSTGEPINPSTYASKGPGVTTFANKVPGQSPDVCWIRDSATCTVEQMNAALNGEGVVLYGVWYKDASDYKPPDSSIQAGVPGSLPPTSPTSTVNGATATTGQPTGVYVATTTPNKKNAAGKASASPLTTLACLVAVALVQLFL